MPFVNNAHNWRPLMHFYLFEMHTKQILFHLFSQQNSIYLRAEIGFGEDYKIRCVYIKWKQLLVGMIIGEKSRANWNQWRECV